MKGAQDILSSSTILSVFSQFFIASSFHFKISFGILYFLLLLLVFFPWKSPSIIILRLKQSLLKPLLNKFDPSNVFCFKFPFLSSRFPSLVFYHKFTNNDECSVLIPGAKLSQGYLTVPNINHEKDTFVVLNPNCDLPSVETKMSSFLNAKFAKWKGKVSGYDGSIVRWP